MKTLLLTSPAGYAQRLLKAFDERNKKDAFQLVSIPMIETTIYTDAPEFVNFIGQLHEFDYVAFSSRKAIDALADYIQAAHVSLPVSVRWCAIGKDNEWLVERLGIQPAFIAEEPSPQGIVRYLSQQEAIKGKRIAVLAPEVIGMEEPSIVPDFLCGLVEIGMLPSRITAYQTRAVRQEVLYSTAQQIQKMIYDAVVFTSGTEIKVFLQMIPEGVSVEEFTKKLTVICYGPYTARCAQQYGVNVDFISTSFDSFQGLVDQIYTYYQIKGRDTIVV